MFADVTCATLSNKNINTLISSFNKEIENISNWFKSNKLSLNLTKTNYVIFRTRNRGVPTTIPNIQIDGSTILRLQTVKFLGIMINEFLNWSIHITDICKCLAKNIGLLSKLKYLLPKNVLFMIYNSIVLPYLNYCNHIWGNTYKSQLSKLYILQKKAARIITKSHVRSPSAPLFKELQILSIYDLITLNTLIFMYSINANSLSDKYSFVLNSNIHNYNTVESRYKEVGYNKNPLITR